MKYFPFYLQSQAGSIHIAFLMHLTFIYITLEICDYLWLKYNTMTKICL